VITLKTVILALAAAAIVGLALWAVVDMRRRPRRPPLRSSQRYPWHAAEGSVYHVCPRCELEADVDAFAVRIGTGDLPLCQSCSQLQNTGEC